MKVLIVSGIWPPDVGGPASHAPELGRFLMDRGHEVRAVTSAGPEGARSVGFPVSASRRDRHAAIRLVEAVFAVGAAARWPDVVYSTGLYYKSVIAATVNRVPLVIKLTADPAFERSRSLGLFDGSLAAFQQPHPNRSIRYLKRVRRAMLGRASRLIIPSHYLADLARGWDLRTDSISVVHNPAPALDGLAPREELRRRLGVSGTTFVFAGRLVQAKNLSLAAAALRHVPDASLIVAGDGPERQTFIDAVSKAGIADRVQLKGALPRREVLEWLRAGDVALLSSAYENFPHAAVEALAVGTPMVATSVGGVPEVIEDGVNGLLVPSGDEEALAGAMRSVAADPELLARLREGAVATARRYDSRQAFEAIERELWAAAPGNRGG